MTNHAGIAPDWEQAIGRILGRAARFGAIVAGALLFGVAVLSVVSIIGRALIPIGLAPIPGIYELVELACGIAVFLFLPWCQLHRGQVSVDFVVNRLPLRFKLFMGVVGDLLLAIGAVIIAVQLWKGFGERFPYGSDTVRQILGLGEPPFFVETTFVLAWPKWIGFAAASVGAFFFAVVCIYSVWRAVNWTLTGAEVLPE